MFSRVTRSHPVTVTAVAAAGESIQGCMKLFRTVFTVQPCGISVKLSHGENYYILMLLHVLTNLVNGTV